MKKLFYLLFLLLTCCSKPNPTVVIDGWWNVDFAKGECETAKKELDDDKKKKYESFPETTKIADACLLDNIGGVKYFENSLMTEFASNPNCKSVHVIYFARPEAENKELDKVQDELHYALSLNFIPGKLTQNWKMISSPKMTSYTEGTGTPQEIANKACLIVNGAGAKLSN